ncbi:hypothetical protein OSC27_01320 [Microbacterium sp. STN6]|uniref:hypothetical protein n=1 Tax=Microbacterium sp. STN6 TaxID=2995588 RepID=UPI002260ABF2|nr:hypothetical protein [Microbacterium sp. STN6]MCX7520911.1 hypothetical protein [Microbacterium sp. STN6]
MTAREQTPQQLDPLGTLSVSRATPVFCVAAFGYALYGTIVHASQTTTTPAAIAALIVLAAASVVLIVLSRPTTAPFSRAGCGAVTALALIAAALQSASTWGENQAVQDDWGQVAIGLLIAGMALSRPVADLLVAGFAGSLTVGAFAVAQSAHLALDAPAGVFAMVAAAPVLAFTVAAAAYSTAMVQRIRRWQHSARASIARLEPEVHEVTARIVHQEQVTLLNTNAVPLFTRLLEQGEITESDVVQAREIAAALRGRAVIALEHTWLDAAVARARTGHAVLPDSQGFDGADAAILAKGVDDPGRLAEHVPPEIRPVLAAFIAAVAECPGYDRFSLRVTLRGVVGGLKANVDANVDAERRATIAALTPYLGVLRVLTRDARLRSDHGRLALKFTYERP